MDPKQGVSEKDAGAAKVVTGSDGGFVVLSKRGNTTIVFARYSDRAAANHKRNQINKWLIPRLAKQRKEALEEAAKTRPPRSAMKRNPGDWYECGWNDAVCAMEDAIRLLADAQKEKKGP